MRNVLTTTIGFVWETAKIVIISLLIIVPIRYFVVQPFFVQGDSMAPTFNSGEYLVIDQLSYRFNEPKRGEVIVFRFPEDITQFFIKRIIGLPGETVIIKDGEVIIRNREHPGGFTLDEPYLARSVNGEIEVRLDDNKYFVLGDNRESSSDSRRWGPLPDHLIIGRAWIRAWPTSRAQTIDTPVY